MLLFRSLLLALPLLAGCGGSEAQSVAPETAPVAAVEPEEVLSLGSAADELVVDEEQVSSSALAGLGGLGAASATKKEAPAATPKASTKPKSDPGLGIDGGRSVTATQIKRVISQNQAQVTACYERELKKNPGLRGKVVVGFVIGGDGRVRPPRIVRNTTRNRAMLPCIKRAVRTWRFPKAEGPADVEYPFAFKPRDF
jgi:outer membrane biosynthesis protein TonB